MRNWYFTAAGDNLKDLHFGSCKLAPPRSDSEFVHTAPLSPNSNAGNWLGNSRFTFISVTTSHALTNYCGGSFDDLTQRLRTYMYLPDDR